MYLGLAVAPATWYNGCNYFKGCGVLLMRRKEEAGRKAPDPVRALERYGDMVYRIALLHMKNQSDAEDVFQEVFLRLVRYAGTIEGEEHLKHWLIRVTVNCCKKQFASSYRRRTVPMDREDRMEFSYEMPLGEGSIWETVRQLPEGYRDVIHLFYYEQYSVREIGEILELTEGAVKTRLSRARDMLREQLEGER